MKITDSAVLLSSDHIFTSKDEKKESLTVWNHNGRREMESNPQKGGQNLLVKAKREMVSAVKVSFSEQAHQTRDAGGKGKKDDELPGSSEVEADLNLRILKALFEKLYGRKIHLKDPDQLAREIEAAGEQGGPDAAPSSPKSQEDQPQEQGWGVIYEATQVHYEMESFSFSAQGTVNTGDGRTLDFSLSLSVSREFMSSESVSLRAGDALKDPLVMNLGTATARVDSFTFSFDLDVDGVADQVAGLAPGSGFLALDRNGDRVINNGSELFGALSGDGFGDLAKFDEDSNGWIDENDAVFNRLSIWSPRPDGSGQMVGLAEAGVGALYLGKTATPFSLKNSANQLQGQIRNSGFFLYEKGGAGTMQQLDLVA